MQTCPFAKNCGSWAVLFVVGWEAAGYTDARTKQTGAERAAGTEQNGGHVYVLFQWQLRSLCEAPQARGVDRKSAYIIGSGLAALTAACYLVRDGQMKGGEGTRF